MTQKEVIEHWRKGAREAARAAEDAHAAGAVGLCLFHCHLALEKAIKSLYMEQRGSAAPFTHGLDALALQVDAPLTEDQRMFLHVLTPQAIKGRYDEIDYHLALPEMLRPEAAIAQMKTLLPLLSVQP